MRRRVARLIALATLATLGMSATPAAATRSLSLGVYDPIVSFTPDAPTWFQRERGLGLQRTRVTAYWRTIAPTRPADGANPGDPAYAFTKLDTAVAQATAAGLDVQIQVQAAPDWAEGADRPKQGAPAGTWKPSPTALGAFGAALARRYPQVKTFAAWNEPNLDTYLTPQWGPDGAPASPSQYRAMLNAFYDGVKGVRPDAAIVGGTTSPYGDLNEKGPSGVGGRMPPAAFTRQFLCVTRQGKRLSGGCGAPAKFDIFDHHPYAIRGPLSPALNADDVSIPDLAKLTGPLRQAVKLRTVFPATPKRLWATEVSWDSNAPDPDGVPIATLVRWIPQTLYTLWNEGADTVMWFLAVDQRPIPSYAATYQSGLWFVDGRPKPLADVYRFPLLVVRRSGRQVAWTRVPAAGRLKVQVRAGRQWKAVATANATRPGQVVLLGLPRLGRRAVVRAVAGDGSISRPWSVTSPLDAP